MFHLIIAFVLGLIALILLAVFINKIPKKLHPVLIVVLLGISGVFAYKLYKSIEEPVKFERIFICYDGTSDSHLPQVAVNWEEAGRDFARVV